MVARLSHVPRALIVIALIVAASACSDHPVTASVIPQQQDEAAAQAVQRTPAVALADGRRLAFNGEWEAALTAYTEALSGPGETGLAARLELARTYDRLNRESEAGDHLGELLSKPVSALVTRGWLLQGSVQRALGNGDAAVAAYGRYIELGGPAASYARLEQARILSPTDRERALQVIAPLVEGQGPAYARRQALRLAGQIEEAAERPDRALARYTALRDLAVSASDRTAALERIGAIAAFLGDIDTAAGALRTLVTDYPYSSEAEVALRSLAEIGRPAGPLAAGIVQYRRGNNQQSRDLLNQSLRENGNRGPGAASALFFLGALAERRNEAGLAIENYTEAYDADPAGPLAVESLWERAGVLHYSGRVEEAQGVYALVVERFPTSRRAPEAAFQTGYIAYEAGRLQEARTRWSAAVTGPGSADTARASFWSGRAAADLGDATGARLAYTEAARRDPNGYYGLRAAAMLAGDPNAPASTKGTITVPPPDWAQAERWLTAWAGPEDTAAWTTAGATEEWRSTMELLQVNFITAGNDAAQTVIAGRAAQPWVLYRMARAFTEAGYPNLAYAAASRLIGRAPADSAVDPAIQRLVYPAPWAELVQYFSDQYGLGPLLFYALMRQESAFNPLAGSSAGAYGLTQVVAPTAGDIARALGSPYGFADLQRPVVAVQFGTYYLGAQLRSFKSNVYAALAAYNAGGGNVPRWQRAGGPSDPDRFYEEVDYSETALYLRLVLQNYAWYRYLYGGAPKPSLTGNVPVATGER